MTSAEKRNNFSGSSVFALQLTVLLANEHRALAEGVVQPPRSQEKTCAVALTNVTPVGSGSVTTTFEAEALPRLAAAMSYVNESLCRTRSGATFAITRFTDGATTWYVAEADV